MSKRHLAALAVFLTGPAVAACAAGEGPLGDAVGDAQSRVSFDLSSRSGPLEVCNEADLVGITVSPKGTISPGPQQAVGTAVGPTPPCEAVFEVTVKKGQRTDFTGEVTGAGRLLMHGTGLLTAAAAKDGFVVPISLTEIPALEVTTETVGVDPVTGPVDLRYSFTVDGAPTDPIGIGATDIVPVNALAARKRIVEIDPTPCAVINGPRARDVTVPVPTADLGEVLYEIDCSGGAGLLLISQTCGSTPFAVRIDGGSPIPFPPGRVLNASGLSAGTHQFELVGFSPNLTVTVAPQNPVSLNVPPGGNVQLTFIATCVTDRAAIDVTLLFQTAPSPGVPLLGTIDVLVDGVVKRTVGPDTRTTIPITITDLTKGPHDVTLELTNSGCTLRSQTPTAGTKIQAPGSIRFMLRCDSP